MGTQYGISDLHGFLISLYLAPLDDANPIPISSRTLSPQAFDTFTVLRSKLKQDERSEKAVIIAENLLFSVIATCVKMTPVVSMTDNNFTKQFTVAFSMGTSINCGYYYTWRIPGLGSAKLGFEEWE